jgi:hypothetical protein
MSKFLIFPLFLFLVGCKSEPKSNNEDISKVEEVVEKEPVSEDELILRLSGDLFADPVGQPKIDRNIIVNYAIDNLLDVYGTPSGLYYQIIEQGTGSPIEWGDRITVHYKGYELDGKEFDSSYKRGQPLTFYVGNMITGWNEGLQLVNTGGKIMLIVPSNLAYGEEGFLTPKGDTLIKPNTVLAFDIEVTRHLGKGER